jgi:hypothetical protein
MVQVARPAMQEAVEVLHDLPAQAIPGRELSQKLAVALHGVS